MLNIIPMPNNITEYGGKRKLKTNEPLFKFDSSFLPEAYEIEITAETAVIRYASERGKFYACKTFSQLADSSGYFPLLKIRDFPRFAYRAFMIDSARHMQSVDEIKRYIEAAAKYKFNYFHWHLCDDQGFRIECKSFPALNTVGSFRKCNGFLSSDPKPYGGFYTKDEIREIVKFCKERYIEVIPEIDMPGHTVAMLASYPTLSCGKKSLEVETRAGVHKDILCAGKEETYSFCTTLLDEILELFDGKYIHIGGDEAPKLRWKSCPDCQRRIQQEKFQNEEELQGYFTERIVSHLEKQGKTAIVWNESLNSGMLSKSVIVCDWLDKKHKSEQFANSGGKIIAEDFFSLYLDYPYAITPLKKTYSFNPILKRLDKTGQKNVIGIETPIWTEYIENFDELCLMCFPRMMAAAETAWTLAENKNYKSFFKRAENERSGLLSLGIKMHKSTRWDPNPAKRTVGIIAHYKKILTPRLRKN